MTYLIYETPMTENAPPDQAKDVPMFILKDLSERVRNIETNIPPRVQEVEGAVKEIRDDLRELNLETKEASKKNEESIRELSYQLQTSTQSLADKHSHDFQLLGAQFAAVGRKIAFVAGIWTTIVTTAGITVAYHKEIIAVLSAFGS